MATIYRERTQTTARRSTCSGSRCGRSQFCEIDYPLAQGRLYLFKYTWFNLVTRILRGTVS